MVLWIAYLDVVCAETLEEKGINLWWCNVLVNIHAVKFNVYIASHIKWNDVFHALGNLFCWCASIFYVARSSCLVIIIYNIIVIGNMIAYSFNIRTVEPL